MWNSRCRFVRYRDFLWHWRWYLQLISMLKNSNGLFLYSDTYVDPFPITVQNTLFKLESFGNNRRISFNFIRKCCCSLVQILIGFYFLIIYTNNKVTITLFYFRLQVPFHFYLNDEIWTRISRLLDLRWTARLQTHFFRFRVMGIHTGLNLILGIFEL